MSQRSNRDRDYAPLAAIQGWLDAHINKRWHSPVWFVLLAFSGLSLTAGVAYGIRFLLGIGA